MSQAHLEHDRVQHAVQRQIDPQAPLFEQQAVRSKLSKFHSHLASLHFQKCSTCSEQFPNMNVITVADLVTECRRCNLDKRIPKLYSSANNMNPGPVPPELQVNYSILGLPEVYHVYKYKLISINACYCCTFYVLYMFLFSSKCASIRTYPTIYIIGFEFILLSNI